MNCKASGLLLRFQKITVYLFWWKRVYKWNTTRGYYSSLPRSPVGNVFLTWSFTRTCWWLFCTALWEGAVGFTGPNFCVSVLQSISDMAMRRGTFSLSEARHTMNYALWSIPLILAHMLCCEFLFYFMLNYLLVLRFVLHIMVRLLWKHFLILLFHFGRFPIVSSPSFLSFWLWCAWFLHRVNRCQGNSLCS